MSKYPLLNKIGMFVDSPDHLLWVENIDAKKATKKFALDREEFLKLCEESREYWKPLNTVTEFILMRDFHISKIEAQDLCIEHKPLLIHRDCSNDKEFTIKYVIEQ